MQQLLLELGQQTKSLADQYIENREVLKELLLCNGSTGLDLSPGDPVALAAYHTINSLETEIKALKKRQSVALNLL